MTSCRWRRDGAVWRSECGTVETLDGSPFDFGWKFCHTCGRPLVAAILTYDEAQSLISGIAETLRYCKCADPENCRETVPGYVCRKNHTVKSPSQLEFAASEADAYLRVSIRRDPDPLTFGQVAVKPVMKAFNAGVYEGRPHMFSRIDETSCRVGIEIEANDADDVRMADQFIVIALPKVRRLP